LLVACHVLVPVAFLGISRLLDVVKCFIK